MFANLLIANAGNSRNSQLKPDLRIIIVHIIIVGERYTGSLSAVFAYTSRS